MFRFSLFASAFALAACMSIAAAPADVAGRWKLVSATVSAEPFDAKATHGTWEFAGDRVTLVGTRKLWYEVDTSVTPHRMTVFNKVGTRRVDLYSCIYRVNGGALDLTFNAGGGDFPTRFESTKDDVSFQLKFKR